MKVFILGGVLLIVGAITVFAVRQRYDDTADKLWVAGAAASILGFAFLACAVVGTVCAKQRINEFLLQKAYIEVHVTEWDEDPLLEIGKVDQNLWLYKAQRERERLGEWSLYPEAVLELEPIE